MSLNTIQRQLDALRAGELAPAEFARQARSVAEGLPLPARYGDALHRVLDSLESSALFEGESCSFSQEDLLQALQQWIDAAGRALRSQANG